MNEHVPDGPVRLLRQRLIDDMTTRRVRHETQCNYLRDVGQFSTWLGRSPHTASLKYVRWFQIELEEADRPGTASARCCGSSSPIRFPIGSGTVDFPTPHGVRSARCLVPESAGADLK